MASGALPDRIGHYKILSRLGAGGMGEVFLAEDPKLDRRVAIKRPLPHALASPEAAHRLLTEARAAARLDHPNVCGIYEVGEDADGPYIVMPLVEGETLATIIDKGPLPIERVVALALQAAEALSAAHAQGVLHRDIKPANIIVGATGQLRIMDFGLAKLGATSGTPESVAATMTQVTAPGITIGTVAYMSPEQARGEKLDGRSDLFSLGVVIYEMVAGNRPFGGLSAAEILAGLLTADPPRLASVRPETPDRLNEIVARLLRRAPAERYQSAQDLVTDLRAMDLRALDAPSRSGSTGLPRRSNRAVLVMAVAVLAIVATAAAWLTLRSPSADTQVAADRMAIDSLAVLPFVDADKSPDREYVADGITESLIRNLAQVPKLRVISRNTVFRFKNRNAEARSIAKELGVRAVMTGTIGSVDGKMVIDIELSSVEDDTVLFSQRYVQDPAHVLKAQSDISQDVVKGLKVLVTGADEQRLAKQATSNRDAYEFFLRGRFFENQLTPPNLRKAIEQYQLAIAADPSYALAYTELAGAHLFLGIYFESPTDSMTAARKYAQQALAIDPQLGDPHVILGMVKLLFDWDYEAAAHELISGGGGLSEQALGILGCTAHLLESGGKLDDAANVLQRALVNDPLSIGLNTEVGCGAYYRRKYDEAIQAYRHALELEPTNDVAYWGIARAFSAKKMYPEALAELDRASKVNSVPAPLVLSELGYSRAKMGQPAEARRILRQMAAPGPDFVDPYLIAIVTVGLGDIDETFNWLEKAYTGRSSFMPSLVEDPKWDVLKSDPRFKDLTKRVGFI